jgi:hypothetical protein
MRKKKYIIEITRIDTRSEDFQVEAETTDDAKRLAIQAAADYDWRRGEAEYVASFVRKQEIK